MYGYVRVCTGMYGYGICTAVRARGVHNNEGVTQERGTRRGVMCSGGSAHLFLYRAAGIRQRAAQRRVTASIAPPAPSGSCRR